MSNIYTSAELPQKFDLKGLSNFFESNSIDDWLEAREREIWLKLGDSAGAYKPKIDAIILKPGKYENVDLFFKRSYKNMLFQKSVDDHLKAAYQFCRSINKKSRIDNELEVLKNRVERARARWACISAKSQREKNGTAGRFSRIGATKIETFENLTRISPVYERMKPISAGRETGDVVLKFSKRSRQRMLNKARCMKKEGLPLPYFVTLTYQHNMKAFKKAKKHLNAFFQRFRRVNSDFRYFWKMEPQKRGAIHFHLAWFPPSDFFPAAWVNYVEKNDLCNSFDIYVEYVRLRISAAWNEITGQDENFEPVRSKNGKVYGNMALYAGTNVRTVENWRMFTGYVGKYMKKEVSENPWDNAKTYIKRREIKNFKGTKAVRESSFNRVRNHHKKSFDDYVIEYESRRTGALHTGRWWGFSRNFDFSAIHSGITDNETLTNLNDFCNTLNVMTFVSITDQLKENAARAKKNLSGERLERRLNHLRNTYEKQKMRYEVNRDKIQEGYSLQFEINHSKVEAAWAYLKHQKIKECPFLIHYYSLN